MEHFLYHITSWGFVKQSFDALADGIMEVRRHRLTLQGTCLCKDEARLNNICVAHAVDLLYGVCSNQQQHR